MSSPIPSDRRVAVTLGGGGTKGAFEVGALDHLVRTAGVRPQVVTSTSAGSILSVVLAQARTADELVAAVDDLRADLLAMTRTDLVFGRQPWVDALQGTPFGDAVDAFVTTRMRPPVPEGDPDPDPATPPTRHHHRWQHLLRLLPQLPAVSRARHELDGHGSSLFTLDPLEQALRGRTEVGITPVDTTRVARPGLDLRLCVTALQSARTRYVCGDGTVVGPDALTPVGASARDAIEGAMTSSSVPMVFPPRRIGDEVYCDGGVLQNIPVHAATQLGAEDVYAIAAVPLDPPRDDVDYTGANLVDVHLRSVQVGFIQSQRDNLDTPVPAGTRVRLIAPTVDVVGPFEVQQGLMLLDMDYGRLRAQEALADLDGPTLALAMDATDRIVVARERSWYLEEAERTDGRLTPERSRALAALKDTVRRQVERRAGLGLDPGAGAQRWWDGPEHHDGSDAAGDGLDLEDPPGR